MNAVQATGKQLYGHATVVGSIEREAYSEAACRPVAEPGIIILVAENHRRAVAKPRSAAVNLAYQRRAYALPLPLRQHTDRRKGKRHMPTTDRNDADFCHKDMPYNAACTVNSHKRQLRNKRTGLPQTAYKLVFGMVTLGNLPESKLHDTLNGLAVAHFFLPYGILTRIRVVHNQNAFAFCKDNKIMKNEQ